MPSGRKQPQGFLSASHGWCDACGAELAWGALRAAGVSRGSPGRQRHLSLGGAAVARAPGPPPDPQDRFLPQTRRAPRLHLTGGGGGRGGWEAQGMWRGEQAEPTTEGARGDIPCGTPARPRESEERSQKETLSLQYIAGAFGVPASKVLKPLAPVSVENL